MTVYEKIYLMNETGNLIGQALFDMITVIFSIIAVGLFAADRLSRTVVIGIAVLSALWVLPMLVMASDQMMVSATIAQTLTPEELGELEGLARYIGSASAITVRPMAMMIVVAHGLTYLGALWFLYDSWRRKKISS